MTSIINILSELDWTTSTQQEAVLQVMHFYGCFNDDTTLPESLLSSDGIKELKTHDMEMEEINSAMQICLKRPIGAERAMLGLDTRLINNDALYSELMQRYDALGMIQAIYPPENTVYDAILLLGSSQPSFSQRLNSLAKFESEKHISGPIYLLGSDRELWPIHEPIMARLLSNSLANAIPNSTCMTEQEINYDFINRFTHDVSNNPEIVNTLRTQAYKEFVGRNMPTGMNYEAVTNSEFYTNLAAISGKTIEDITKHFTNKFLEEVRTKPAILNKVRAEIYAEFRALGAIIPTEADMMYELVDQSVLKDTPHIKIETGKRADGSRANTEDTVIKFDEYYRAANTQMDRARILVISTQPEALYQKEPVRKVLTPEKGYGEIDVGAEAAKYPVNPLVINDAIARKVYSRLEQKSKYFNS